MSTYKRGNKWIADVTDTSTGFRTRRTARTQREAKQLEKELREQIKALKIPKIGIESALTEYIKTEAQLLKDKKGIISKAKAIRPFIHQKTFEQIGEVAAELIKDNLQKGLKPATINRRLALLRRLANLAFQWGWINTQHGKRIKLLKGETERHYYLTIQQIKTLANHCPRTKGLILISGMTGLRRSELLKLTPENIINNEWIALGTNTKNNKPRLVPIPKIIRKEFDNYHWPLDKSYNQLLRKEFEAARKKLNLSHIRYHDLRHSYASFLVQNGATLQHVGKALGHSSTQMTNRYAHLMDENLMALADKFT